METLYTILINLKKEKEIVNIGHFRVGNDAALASSIFRKMKGTDRVNEKSILYMELVETRDGLPFNLQMLGCTLEEMAGNCRLITKEIFKYHNLEESEK